MAVGAGAGVAAAAASTLAPGSVVAADFGGGKGVGGVDGSQVTIACASM